MRIKYYIYSDSLFEIHVYQFERKDSTVKLNHGIGLYISDSLTFTRRHDLECNSVDSLWREVQLPKTRPILLGSVYRSPNSSAGYQESLKENISSALSQGLETVVIGDFNHDLLPHRKDASTKDLVDYARAHLVTQMVGGPTRVTDKSSTRRT